MAPTEEQINNAGLDIQTIGSFVTAAADAANSGHANGTVTNRTGSTFDNLAKIVASLMTSVSSAATSATGAGTSKTASDAALADILANQEAAEAGRASVDLNVAQSADAIYGAGKDQVARSMARIEQTRVNDIDARLRLLESGGTGWIIGARIHQSGWYGEFDMLSAHGTPTPGSFDLTKMFITVYRWGYDVIDGQLVKVIRDQTFKPTALKRKASPNEAQDEVNTTGGVTTWQIAFPDQVFLKERNGGDGTTGLDPVLSTTTGFYTDSGSTQAKGQVFVMENNSAEVYPRPCAQPQTPPNRLLGDQPVFEIMGSGLHPHNARGLAGARLTLTGTTSGAILRKVVSTLTLSAWAPTKIYPSMVYAVTLTTPETNLFTQGEIVTERWEVYPWTGDEAAVLDSANGGGEVTNDFSSRTHIVNRTGAYPLVYALVDPVAGVNSTGVAHSTEATALASPFLNDHFALYKAHVYGLANYGANNYRVIIEFDNGDTALRNSPSNIYSPSVDPSLEDSPSGGLCPTWTVYKPKAGSTTARLISATAAGYGYVPPRTRIEGLTVHASVSSRATITRGTSSPATLSQVWLKDCVFTDDGLAVNLPLLSLGQAYMTGCSSASLSTVQYLLNVFGNTATQWKLGRDIDFALLTGGIAALSLNGVRILACAASGGFIQPSVANTNLLHTDGSVWCNVALFKCPGTAFTIDRALTKGIARINFFTEVIGTGIQPAWRIGADGINVTLLAPLYLDNFGYLGARGNWGYEDTFTMDDGGVAYLQLKKLFRLTNGYLWEFNHKDDAFQGVAARIHTWNIGHHVGFKNNNYLKASTNGATAPSRTGWLGEAFGLGEAYLAGYLTTTTWQSGIFTDYQAGQVGTGGGNYQPPSGTTLNRVAANDLACPYDLMGTTRYADGTSAVGPIERAA
jgi:hypothetical protein